MLSSKRPEWAGLTCGEKRIEEETAVTTGNRPFSLKQEPGACVACGKPSPGRVVFSKAS